MSGYWDRDLAIDLGAIRGGGAAAVVTLVEQKELAFLRVERIGERSFAEGRPFSAYQSIRAAEGRKRIGRDLALLVPTMTIIVA